MAAIAQPLPLLLALLLLLLPLLLLAADGRVCQPDSGGDADWQREAPAVLAFVANESQAAVAEAWAQAAVAAGAGQLRCRQRVADANPLLPQLPLPSLLVLAAGERLASPLLEAGAEALIARLASSAEPRQLDDSNFEALTQAATGGTTGHWLVAFLPPGEQSLISRLPLLHAYAHSLRASHTNVGIVPLGVASQTTAARFGVADDAKSQTKETLVLVRDGSYYVAPCGLLAPRCLLRFARAKFNDQRRRRVPPPPSPFDHVVEAALTFLLSFNDVFGLSPVFVALSVVLSLLLLCVVCVCVCAGKGVRKVVKAD